jgi:CheY-like chemotaxis protein
MHMSTSILVVDDNPPNLKLAVQLLTYDGYAVAQACDAETALAMIRTTSPTLVLLDLQLPRMDGLELARILKADEKTRPVSLIAFTAHAMKGDVEMATAAGCDGYMTKPINTRTFSAEVAAFVAATKGRSKPEHT